MRNIIGFFILVFSIQIQAQTLADALRYSSLEVGGTARTVGVGGALGALGADYAVLSSNPAGLATFRTNEFVITPVVFNARTNSLLVTGGDNSYNSESIARFGLNNIGMILNNRPRRSKWKTFNFGIGYNRLATFNQEFTFRGTSQGSIVDRFTELANDGIFDLFEVDLADQVVAIYTDASNPDFFINDFDDADPNYVVEREQTVRTTGSYSELVLSLASNYNEKLMIGATMGIPLINYEQEKTYEESELPNADAVPFFNNLKFQETVSTSGVGINLKLGLIYRINQMFRLGAAFHTPTAFRLEDSFANQLTYNFTDANGGSNLTADSPVGDFNYRLRNPWRAMLNFATLFHRKGFISADIEYVDYTAANFNLTSNSSNIEDEIFEMDLNNQIDDELQSAINIRIGGEYAMNKLRFRAGYAISGTPYADSDIINNAYSLGFGFRQKKFYLDLAYRLARVDENYVPFLLANPEQEQMVANETSNSQFIMTAGFKF